MYKVTALVYNEAGEIVRHLYSFMDDPGLDGVMGVKLSTTVIKPSSNPVGGTPSQLSVMLSNGTTLVWDGRSDSGSFVQGGQYFVEVHSADGQGGDTTVTEQVSVMGADVTGTVIAMPNILDKTKGNTTTTFTVNTPQTVTLKVNIYTIAGERVAILEGQAGQGTATWNASGLASGMYLAVVNAKDANGAFVSQQILKILIIH